MPPTPPAGQVATDTVGSAVPTLPPPPPQPHVSLRSARGLLALEQALGSPPLAMRVASRWSTWAEVAAAPLVELARATGGRALRLPALCPPLPDLPEQVGVVCRFDAAYPQVVSDLPDVPGVLFVSGALPTGPAVTVAGTQHPSTTGYRLARRAAALAHARQVVVVGVLDGGCGEAAVDEALDAAVPVIAVVPYGLARLHATNRRLVGQVLESGGALVSAEVPTAPRSPQTMLTATRLAVALAPATFLAEAGLSTHQGLAAASGALEAARYLVVPDHHDPRSVELSGLGSMALSRNDPLTALTDAPRLRERLASGNDLADAVVTDDDDLAAALAYGSGASPSPPPRRDMSGWICLE